MSSAGKYLDYMAKEASWFDNTPFSTKFYEDDSVRSQDFGRAPELAIIDRTRKTGGPSLKASRDYAAKVRNSPEMQAARNSGNIFNDIAVGVGNLFRGSKNQQLSVRQQNIQDVYARNIRGEDLDQLNADKRAAMLQTAYDAERAGGNLNKMNPSTSLGASIGSSPVQHQIDKRVTEGMKNVKQQTREEFNRQMGEAINKWGPWVASLGLGGIGLYLGLNSMSRSAQQPQQLQPTPPPGVDWIDRSKFGAYDV